MGETEHRVDQVRDHLIRASKSLLAAETLHEYSLYEDSISRAYYVTFHASKALLIGIGEDSKTHRDIHHLIYTHFVKTGIVSVELHKGFANLLNLRGDADYGIIPRFSKEEVLEGLKTAADLLLLARSWLSEKFKTSFN